MMEKMFSVIPVLHFNVLYILLDIQYILAFPAATSIKVQERQVNEKKDIYYITECVFLTEMKLHVTLSYGVGDSALINVSPVLILPQKDA